MRGYIRKRGKGSWSITLSLGYDPSTGKRLQRSYSVRGPKRDAEKRLAELLTQADKGRLPSPSKVTLAGHLDRWLTDYVKPSLAPRTAEGYQYIASRYVAPVLGAIPLTRLKGSDLQRYYACLLADGLSPQTVRHHHTLIHKALATARKWGEVDVNVADGVELPRAPRPEMVVWTEPEVVRFLEAAQVTQYYALFYAALFTGARRSELLGLRWGDVDLLLGQVRVVRGLHHLKTGEYVFSAPKSAKSRRMVALTPSTIAVLRDHRHTQSLIRLVDDDSLVFAGADGAPVRPNTVTRAWTILAERCGVRRIRLHDARHTHASLMLKRNIHPRVVQERLGHGSISITLDTYSHVAPGLQEAAARQFDEVFSEGLVGKRWANLPESTPIG